MELFMSINLLPWRQAKTFRMLLFVYCGGAVLMVFLILISWLLLNQMQSRALTLQNQQYLFQDELRVLQKQFRPKLIKEILVLQQTTKIRQLFIKNCLAILALIPEGVMLNNFHLTDTQLKMDGVILSNSNLDKIADKIYTTGKYNSLSLQINNQKNPVQFHLEMNHAKK